MSCRIFCSIPVSPSWDAPFLATKSVFRHFQISPEEQNNNSPPPGWEPPLYILSLSNPTNTLGFSYDLHVNHTHYITSVQTLCLSSSDSTSFWIFQRDCKAESKKCYSSYHTSSLVVSYLLSRTIHSSPSFPISSQCTRVVQIYLRSIPFSLHPHCCTLRRRHLSVAWTTAKAQLWTSGVCPSLQSILRITQRLE